LIAVFCGLLLNFVVIASFVFFIPLVRKGFFIWIGSFFVLGLALVIMAIKQKVERRLKFFLILTGGSAAGFVASILLHNFLSALLGPAIGLKEEPVFFFIAVLVCPIAFLVGAIGSVIMLIRRRG
jgi:hypothetical protein